MPVDRLERSGLNRAWIEATAALPLGWHLDGLTCASTGLAPEQCSDRWRAWATAPTASFKGSGASLSALGANSDWCSSAPENSWR